MGSSKFCATALVSTAITTSIQLATLAVAPHFRSVRPGPYAFIFTFMVQYYSKLLLTSSQCMISPLSITIKEYKHAYVPSAHSSNISSDVFFLRNAWLRQTSLLLSRHFGLCLNYDPNFIGLIKFVVWGDPALSIFAHHNQLLLSSGQQSFIAGFPGILVGGVIASNNSLQLRLRMPNSLSNMCRKYILPLITSNPPHRPQTVSGQFVMTCKNIALRWLSKNIATMFAVEFSSDIRQCPFHHTPVPTEARRPPTWWQRGACRCCRCATDPSQWRCHRTTWGKPLQLAPSDCTLTARHMKSARYFFTVAHKYESIRHT